MQIQSNGIRMHVEIGGDASLPADAPWVSFLPGIANDATFWAAQAAAVEQGYRTLRFDPRGHGDSESTPGDYSFDLTIADLLGLWDALGIASSHVVGLGYGGSMGIGLALQQPQRVRSLLAVACRAVMSEDFRAAWIERSARVRRDGVASFAAPTVARWFSDEFKAANPQVLQRVQAMVERTSTDGYCGYANAFIGLDYVAQLPQLQVPVTFVSGGKDFGGGHPDIMAAMTAAVPGATQVIIPGVGHICNLEAPLAFNEVLRVHLAQHSNG